jgi:hypothetical protein
MGSSAESAGVDPDAFVRDAPRACLWRGALASHDSIGVHFGCSYAPLRFAQGRGADEGVRPYTA